MNQRLCSNAACAQILLPTQRQCPECGTPWCGNRVSRRRSILFSVGVSVMVLAWLMTAIT
jgi:hypothetical protein